MMCGSWCPRWTAWSCGAPRFGTTCVRIRATPGSLPGAQCSSAGIGPISPSEATPPPADALPGPRPAVGGRAHPLLANRFRKLLVRFEKLRVSHVALLELACALIAFRQTIVIHG